MKKFLVLMILIFISIIPAYAAEKIKEIVNIHQEVKEEEFPETISFTAQKDMMLYKIHIPKDSKVVASVLEWQKERRWHKSGFMVLRVQYYETPDGEKIDIERRHIYLVARKYEKLKGKEIAKTATELIITTSASYFVPGIDLLYYFTKGAIQRKKHPNWFKAGISNAYDYSIFWFFQKGKPIKLKEQDKVILKSVKRKRANRLVMQIKKRKLRKIRRALKRKLSEEEQYQSLTPL